MQETRYPLISLFPPLSFCSLPPCSLSKHPECPLSTPLTLAPQKGRSIQTWRTDENTSGWAGRAPCWVSTRATSAAQLTAELDQNGFTCHFLFLFCGKGRQCFKRTKRGKCGLMENRGVWKWMEKELRTMKSWRVGVGSSWGHCLPETPRTHAFFACPSPLHGLMRRPLGFISVLGRGSELSDSLARSVSGGLSPSSAKVFSLCKVLFCFFWY